MSEKHRASTHFGRGLRARNRKRNEESIRKGVDELLNQFLPELNRESVNIEAEWYNQQITKLLNAIHAKYQSIQNLRIARNYLSKFINEGNKQARWELHVPPFILRVQRESPLRTEKWFRTTAYLNKWKKQWYIFLDNRTAIDSNLSSEELLGFTLISSAFFGGLCTPELLSALKEKLENNARPLCNYDGDISIELDFDSKNFAHNVTQGGSTRTLRRWYPDNITLGWIHNFLTHRDKSKVCASSSAWTTICNALGLIEPNIKSRIKSLKKFSEAAIGITENIDGIELSQAMVGYLVGTVSSSSLPTESYNAIFSRTHYDTVQAPQLLMATHRSPTEKVQINRRYNFSINYEKLITEMRDALKSKKSGTKKVTPKTVKESLERINTENYPPPVSVFLQWMISLISGKKKVSTVSRYFSAIAKPWLAATAEIHIDELDSEEFESLYRDILDVQQSEKNRQYMSGRFKQFHLYLSQYHNFPSLSVNFDESVSSTRPFIRAGFIPERAFNAFMSSITHLPETDHSKQGLQCLYIMAYRCGLRRGELLKLRVKDIEPSQESWIFIRNNRYGNNKSSSALRKLPLRALLLKNEAQLFERYLAYKKSLDKSDNGLLFSLEQSNQIPLNGNYISTIAKVLLSQIMGIPVIFHHFRHTALSRLQVILDGDEDLVSTVVAYPATQIREITQTLDNLDGSRTKRDIYWAIAGFAGHISPETTFNSYLHFSDRIVAAKIKKGTHDLSSRVIKEITGFSSNLTTRIGGAQNDGSNSLSIDEFAPTIKRKLKKYTHTELPIASRTLERNQSIENEANYFYGKVTPTAEICYNVLKAAEQRVSLYDLVVRFNLDEEIIQKWLQRAKLLTSLSTSKDKSRLFSRYQITPPVGIKLAPAKPQSDIELMDANQAIDKLRVLYHNNKEEMKWCINYFLKNTNRSKPVLHFSSTSDLDRYLSLMIRVFPSRRWKLTLYCPKVTSTSSIVEEWKKNSHNIFLNIANGQVKGGNKYPKGKMLLQISHPEENSIKDKRKVSQYSTNVVTYIFHILKIMM